MWFHIEIKRIDYEKLTTLCCNLLQELLAPILDIDLSEDLPKSDEGIFTSCQSGSVSACLFNNLPQNTKISQICYDNLTFPIWWYWGAFSDRKCLTISRKTGEKHDWTELFCCFYNIMVLLQASLRHRNRRKLGQGWKTPDLTFNTAS